MQTRARAQGYSQLCLYFMRRLKSALKCPFNFNDETYMMICTPESPARKKNEIARIPFSLSLSNTFPNGCIHTRDVLVNQTRTNAFRIIAASGNCRAETSRAINRESLARWKKPAGREKRSAARELNKSISGKISAMRRAETPSK